VTYFSPLNILAPIVITHYQCASLFVLVISQILIAERRVLSLFQKYVAQVVISESDLYPLAMSLLKVC
jgi:hypothetical protein